MGCNTRSRCVSKGVLNQEGAILRVDNQSNSLQAVQEKTIKDHFLSYLAIGQHAELSANYQMRKKEENSSFINKFIFNVESMKKFCCIGKPSL